MWHFTVEKSVETNRTEGGREKKETGMTSHRLLTIILKV